MPETQSVITLRWSSIAAYMGCQRKYDFAYNQGLVRKPGPEAAARILGSHVHAGIDAALRLSFDHDAPTIDLVTQVVAAARRYNHETRNHDQKVYDWETRTFVPDIDYRVMMDNLLEQAITILRYQVPRIGLGTKYRVASVGEVIGGSTSEYEAHEDPMVEWQFTEPFEFDGNDYLITGTADTVLQDIETGEYLLVDWKTRAVMPDERLVDLDGQLKLYAAVINHLAGKNVITRTCQWQLLTKVPQPVKLTEKKREVSKAAPASTWEIWSESVAALGLDPEDYRAEMEPKMHAPGFYSRPVFTPVTPAASHRTLDNVLRIGEMIRYSRERQSWPSLPSLKGCQWCDFKNLCRVRAYGGDEQFVIDTEYEIGDPDAEIEEEGV